MAEALVNIFKVEEEGKETKMKDKWEPLNHLPASYNPPPTGPVESLAPREEVAPIQPLR